MGGGRDDKLVLRRGGRRFRRVYSVGREVRGRIFI